MRAQLVLLSAILASASAVLLRRTLVQPTLPIVSSPNNLLPRRTTFVQNAAAVPALAVGVPNYSRSTAIVAPQSYLLSKPTSLQSSGTSLIAGIPSVRVASPTRLSAISVRPAAQYSSYSAFRSARPNINTVHATMPFISSTVGLPSYVSSVPNLGTIATGSVRKVASTMRMPTVVRKTVQTIPAYQSRLSFRRIKPSIRFNKVSLVNPLGLSVKRSSIIPASGLSRSLLAAASHPSVSYKTSFQSPSTVPSYRGLLAKKTAFYAGSTPSATVASTIGSGDSYFSSAYEGITPTFSPSVSYSEPDPLLLRSPEISALPNYDFSSSYQGIGSGEVLPTQLSRLSSVAKRKLIAPRDTINVDSGTFLQGAYRKKSLLSSSPSELLAAPAIQSTLSTYNPVAASPSVETFGSYVNEGAPSFATKSASMNVQNVLQSQASVIPHINKNELFRQQLKKSVSLRPASFSNIQSIEEPLVFSSTNKVNLPSPAPLSTIGYGSFYNPDALSLVSGSGFNELFESQVNPSIIPSYTAGHLFSEPYSYSTLSNNIPYAAETDYISPQMIVGNSGMSYQSEVSHLPISGIQASGLEYLAPFASAPIIDIAGFQSQISPLTLSPAQAYATSASYQTIGGLPSITGGGQLTRSSGIDSSALSQFRQSASSALNVPSLPGQSLSPGIGSSALSQFQQSASSALNVPSLSGQSLSPGIDSSALSQFRQSASSALNVPSLSGQSLSPAIGSSALSQFRQSASSALNTPSLPSRFLSSGIDAGTPALSSTSGLSGSLRTAAQNLLSTGLNLGKISGSNVSF